jgi:hypothetical protein
VCFCSTLSRTAVPIILGNPFQRWNQAAHVIFCVASIAYEHFLVVVVMMTYSTSSGLKSFWLGAPLAAALSLSLASGSLDQKLVPSGSVEETPSFCRRHGYKSPAKNMRRRKLIGVKCSVNHISIFMLFQAPSTSVTSRSARYSQSNFTKAKQTKILTSELTCAQ